MSGLPDRVVEHLAEQLARPALPDRYEPLDVVGRGGMGVVWRTHDHVLRRDVAVKILGEHVEAPELAARLAHEARILARLEHPGIVAVHDAGTLPDGRTWYAMRLVRGERLDAAARRFNGLGDVLRVLLRLAETVAFAHDRGVIHRDINPRNVMLAPFGQVLILDWGVARDRRAPEPAAGQSQPPDGTTTAHGTVLGTPGYMAPEQAQGLVADVRSDVYGLGGVLRDLLQTAGTAVPKALRAIRDRALAEAPADRYADVGSFRRDLVRFQDGEPVTAYREGPVEVLMRRARRYRTAIVLVLAYLVMRMAILLWRGI